MHKNKNAHPTAATVEQAEAEMTACRASIPMFDCTTVAAGRQRKVSELLNRGRENAVPLRHLKKLMETDGRTVRLMIQQERLSGMPICADNLTGYYLPANEEEKSACVRSMRRRAAEIIKTALAIERGAGLD